MGRVSECDVKEVYVNGNCCDRDYDVAYFGGDGYEVIAIMMMSRKRRKIFALAVAMR